MLLTLSGCKSVMKLYCNYDIILMALQEYVEKYDYD